MSEMKDLAKLLLAELAPALGAIVKAEVQKHVPAALVPLAVTAVDVGVQFAEGNPGVGGAPPSVHDVAANGVVAEDTPDDEKPSDLDIAGLNAFCRAMNAKVDALVQATGHGNSAAMAAHL